MSFKSFKDLISDPKLLKAIEELGHTIPTPIQEQAIPEVIAGRDLRASAQTGTGKTAAFLLPAMMRLLEPSTLPPTGGFGPRVLILVPTRELAMQVATEAAKYGKHLTRVKTVCIYGGTPYPIQNRELGRPYEILVATPGRLIDHINRGRINLAKVEMFILDEADRMLDMGFIDDVEQIAAATPKSRQTLMFSATLKGSVLQLSKRLLNDPLEIAVAPDQEDLDNIEQRLHYVDNIGHKHRLLDHLLNDLTFNQAIVFTSTKSNADQLVDKLIEGGHHAAALHGDMNQRQRTQTITRLRQGKIRILVATDVAARGIDVQSISHVINFDLPNSAENYVHRIGRTGRAGAKGMALSFAVAKEMELVRRIEQFTGQKITATVIAGMEPKFEARAPRSDRGGDRGPRRDGGGGGGYGRRDSAPRGDGGGYPRRDSAPRGDGGGNGGGYPRRDSAPRGDGGGYPRRDSAPRGDGGYAKRDSAPRSDYAPRSDSGNRRDGGSRREGGEREFTSDSGSGKRRFSRPKY